MQKHQVVFYNPRSVFCTMALGIARVEPLRLRGFDPPVDFRKKIQAGGRLPFLPESSLAKTQCVVCSRAKNGAMALRENFYDFPIEQKLVEWLNRPVKLS
jgi:hypothetical protein